MSIGSTINNRNLVFYTMDDIEKEDVLLKLSYIGYPGEINPEENQKIYEWLYKNYGIFIDDSKPSTINIFFETRKLSTYFYKDLTLQFWCSLKDILALWKCNNGVLSGPSIDNYINPNREWS